MGLESIWDAKAGYGSNGDSSDIGCGIGGIGCMEQSVGDGVDQNLHGKLRSVELWTYHPLAFWALPRPTGRCRMTSLGGCGTAPSGIG